jgi:hypothetical protein
MKRTLNPEGDLPPFALSSTVSHLQVNEKYADQPLAEEEDQKDLARIPAPPKNEKEDEGRPDREKEKGPPHVAVKEGPKAMQQSASRTRDA